MMDGNTLFIDPFHPVDSMMKRDFSGFARYKTRTERPVKYYLIDFGLSRRYDDSITHPLEVPIWGGDKEVPEFQNSNEPCDPFATDVFYIGNAIRKDFVDVGPLHHRTARSNPPVSQSMVSTLCDHSSMIWSKMIHPNAQRWMKWSCGLKPSGRVWARRSYVLVLLTK